MSTQNREAVIDLRTSTSEPPPRSERKARIAELLSRSIVEDRLNVRELPNDLYLEWVPMDDTEINRKKALGYRIPDENDKWIHGNALHSDATGKPIVGDVIAMVCDRETKELIDEVQAERAAMNSAPRRNKGEKDFEKQNENSGPGKTINEGTVEKRNIQSVLDALPT